MSKDFQLKGSSSEFSSRVQDTFKDLLNPSSNTSLGSNTSTSSSSNTNTSSSSNTNTSSSSNTNTSSKEVSHCFKIPPPKPSDSTHPREAFHRRRPHHSRRHSTPAGKRDPSKYTKYDLSDVEVSSDKGNARAAFSFIQEIRKRSSDGSLTATPPDLDRAKFSFKKPRIKDNNDDDDDHQEKREVPQNRRVLPEAHIGERPRGKALVHPNMKASKSTLTLSHLEEDEEDEED